MGLLDRVNRALAESRVITSVPWKPWDDPSLSFAAGGPARPSLGKGLDGALALAPVYAATRLLADNVAAMPLQQYRDTGTRRQRLPLGSLLTKPSAYGTLFDWLYIGMTSLLLQGNAYGLITARDGYGYPTSIEWLPPERVVVVDVEPYNPALAKFYYWGKPLDRENLLHVRGYAVAGRTEGVSPLRAFRMLIEAGQDALAYGADWYKAGGFPPGTFKNTQYEVDDDQSDAIRDKLLKTMRRRAPLVYGRDWEYKALSVPPNEAQFIEAMQLNATQIAAIYGVPPERVGGRRGDSLTYDTQEHESIALVTETLDPWLVRWETALYDCLPEKQYARFNRDARIRTDIKTRYECYEIARQIGLRNIDELRELEDLEPVSKMSDRYDGSDYTPLEVLVSLARYGTEITPDIYKEKAEEPSPGSAAPSAQQPPAPAATAAQ